MKDKQKDLQKNAALDLQRARQHQATLKNQLPPTDNATPETPTDKIISDTPSDQPISPENDGNKQPKDNTGFTGNEHSKKSKRPTAGDDNSRLL